MNEALHFSPERQQKIHELFRSIHEYGRAGSARELAADAVVAMVERWDEIEANWDAADLGFGETPEERERWELAFIRAGEGILGMAEMLLPDE